MTDVRNEGKGEFWNASLVAGKREGTGNQSRATHCVSAVMLRVAALAPNPCRRFAAHRLSTPHCVRASPHWVLRYHANVTSAAVQRLLHTCSGALSKGHRVRKLDAWAS